MIWSSTWLAIKIGLKGAPIFTSIAVRMLIATTIVALIMRLRRIPLPRDTRFVRLGVFLGFFHIVLPYTLVYYGEQHIASGLASVIYAILPLIVAVLARFMLGNRLTPRKLAGIAAGISGVAVIFSDSLSIGREQALATLAVLGSVTAASVGSVATKKWSHADHPVASLLIPFATATVFSTLMALVAERVNPFTFNLTTWGSIVYLAAVGSVSAFSLFFYVVQRVDITIVSYQTFIIPILAVLLGRVVLDEHVSPRVGVGAAMILVGIALATFFNPRGMGARRG